MPAPHGSVEKKSRQWTISRLQGGTGIGSRVPCVRMPLAVNNRKPNSDWLRQVAYLLAHLTASQTSMSHGSLGSALLCDGCHVLGLTSRRNSIRRTRRAFPPVVFL